MENLDLKDKKLLFELDFNARLPYSKLAKKIGLSKQGTEYKLNSLIKRGIITGFYPIINMPKLGYIYCRLLITLQNTTETKEKEIIKYLKNHENVFWLLSMQGPYDLLIVTWSKSINDFKEFIEELQTNFGGHIKRKVETITTDVIHYQHRYLLNKEKTEEIHIKETTERISIDELDKSILGTLCSDTRISLVNLANKLNESPKVIAYRIKRLEEKKLIEGYRPIIDNNKLGYTYYKIFISLNNSSKEELKQIKFYIKNNSHVIYIVEGLGLPSDLDIEMMIGSNQELFDFIKDLKFKFPKIIGEYTTIVFTNTLKVKYFL
nr:hypothetical protein [Nanoarchaeum sp.]